MNFDPTRPHSLVDENIDAGDPDIPLVEKNDISLSDRLGCENDRAIVLRGGFNDLRVSDQYGLERLIGGKRRYKIGPQGNRFCRFLRAGCTCVAATKIAATNIPAQCGPSLAITSGPLRQTATFSDHWAVLEPSLAQWPQANTRVSCSRGLGPKASDDPSSIVAPQAMKPRGGRMPASTRPRLPASSGMTAAGIRGIGPRPTSHAARTSPAIILDLSIPGSPGEPKPPWQRRTNDWRKATSPARGQGG